jgi:small subunit ribosomal protein S13
MEERLFAEFNPNETFWNTLQQVPGLSLSSISKICALFNISRKSFMKDFTEDELKVLEQFIFSNFLVGYKLIRQMSLAVTTRFISRSRRGIRSRQGLPINGQRTHSNGKTPRRLRGHWVLPEVLRNPIAYFSFNKDKKQANALLNSLGHLKKKPQLHVEYRNMTKAISAKIKQAHKNKNKHKYKK